MKIKISRKSTLPVKVDGKNLKVLVSEGRVFTFVSVSESGIIENEERAFGNIIIKLIGLGKSNYRIDWHSRMTGGTTSLAKLNKKDYAVLRKWADIKAMPNISQKFDTRKEALVHFLNNVEIYRSADNAMAEAKNFCLKLFALRENLPEPKNQTFRRFRLQGAIGKEVIVRSRNSKDHILADGILLQLVGKDAQLQLNNIYDLRSKKDIQKFPAQQVFIK